MRPTVEVKFPKIFKPLDDPYRYKVMYGGRGSAKSWSVARKLLIKGTEQKLLILCTRELQKSIKQSVHRLLKTQIDKLQLNGFYKVTENSIKGINGTEFIFMGVRHNVDEIKSTEGVDICWIEEAHNLTETSWDLIDPTIRKEGSEIWITYNTRFKHDCIHSLFVIKKVYKNAWVKKINFSDNPFFPEVLRIQMEAMKLVSFQKYLNIWMGEIKQLAEGAIFGDQITKVRKTNRLTYIPIQPTAEVHTFWDLGRSDYTAIWFICRIDQQYHVIDYFQGRLKEPSYYIKAIKSLGYSYGNHYMPHDAKHQRMGMKRTLEDQFRDGGVRPIVVVERTPDKVQAINATREIFASCWFHLGNDENRPDEDCEGYIEALWMDDPEMRTRAKRMEKGFEALSNYRYAYKDEDDVYVQTPHHDWASNGADAFQQFGQSHHEVKTIGKSNWDEINDYEEEDLAHFA